MNKVESEMSAIKVHWLVFMFVLSAVFTFCVLARLSYLNIWFLVLAFVYSPALYFMWVKGKELIRLATKNSDVDVDFINDVFAKKIICYLTLWAGINLFGFQFGVLGLAVSAIASLIVGCLGFLIASRDGMDAIAPGAIVFNSTNTHGRYARLNQSLIIETPKGIGPVAGFADKNPSLYLVNDDVDFVRNDVSHNDIGFCEVTESHQTKGGYSMGDVNPASGLPMLTDNIDVGGNVFGTNRD